MSGSRERETRQGPSAPQPPGAQDDGAFEFIAHRGDARRYPENTIEAFRSALDAGARYVEFDVHMSADRVPIVHHDEVLRRTTGVEGRVWERTAEELLALDAGERERFGDRFAGTRVPRLDRVAELLAAAPGVFAFVELKRSSVARFGAESFVESALEALAPLEGRFAIISFAIAPLVASRAAAVPIGWIIERYDEATHSEASRLGPEYIFAEHGLLGTDARPLWSGPWRWAIYEVDDMTLARALVARGASLIETMAIAEMLPITPPSGG